MYVDGIWLKDADGRARILRGANLSGSTKVPYTPRRAVVEVSDGSYTFDHETQILTYRHTSDRSTHTIKITPRPP